MALVDAAKAEFAARERRDVFRALLLCALAVLVVRSFLVVPVKIPSSSMVPSLLIGDHIFVSKFDYGLAVPFTRFELLRWSGPKRGDIIVFLFPRDESLYYIKRVAAVPGDRVRVKGHELWVNGEKVVHQPLQGDQLSTIARVRERFGGEYALEKLGDAQHFVRFSQPGDAPNGSTEETVPADRYFVIGDNRDDSYDSRAWGFVPRSYIRGKARMIWLSLDPDQNWNSPAKIRWERCGTPVY